jgi:methyl-accepting chemotaxis protein
MGIGREQQVGRSLALRLIAIPVLIGLTLTTYYIWANAAAARNQHLRERVIGGARDIAARIRPMIDHTRQLAHLIEQARASGSDRDIIKGLAVPTLDLRAEFLGIGVALEPNGYDGRDADYAGHYPENDDHGRFSAYYYRETGKPAATTSLAMAELDNPRAWYQVSLKGDHPIVLVPYAYPVDGIAIPVSSVAIPMRDGNKPIGVTLIDFKMQDVVAAVAAMKSAEFSGAWIIGPEGYWVVHPDKDKTGTQLVLANSGAENEIEMLRRAGGAARTGTPQTRTAQSGETYFMTPIPLDGIDQPWLLVMSAPQRGVWDILPSDMTKIATFLGVTLLIGGLGLVQLWMMRRGDKTLTLTSVISPRANSGGAKTRNFREMRPVPPRRREPTVRRR